MPQRQAGHRHVRLQAGFDQSLLAGRIITPPAVAQHADDLKPQWVRWIAHHWCPLPRWWTPSLAYLIEAYYVRPIERLPSRHQQTPPPRFRVNQALLQRGLTLADDRRSSDLARRALGRRSMKCGVKPETGDHGDPWPHVIEQIDCGKACTADAD